MVPYVPALRAATAGPPRPPLASTSSTRSGRGSRGASAGSRARLYLAPPRAAAPGVRGRDAERRRRHRPGHARGRRDLPPARRTGPAPRRARSESRRPAFPDRSGPGDPRTLVFLGSLDWRPNLEAVTWFLESVWPLVRQAVPEARFLLGGSNPAGGPRRRLGGEGVRFLGRVPTTRATSSPPARRWSSRSSPAEGSGSRSSRRWPSASRSSRPGSARAGIGARDGTRSSSPTVRTSSAEACVSPPARSGSGRRDRPGRTAAGPGGLRRRRHRPAPPRFPGGSGLPETLLT